MGEATQQDTVNILAEEMKKLEKEDPKRYREFCGGALEYGSNVSGIMPNSNQNLGGILARQIMDYSKKESVSPITTAKGFVRDCNVFHDITGMC
jgi:hypothetical protein